MSEAGEFSTGNPRRIEFKDEESRISVKIEIDKEYMDNLSPLELEIAALMTAGFVNSIAAAAEHKEELAMMGLTPKNQYSAMVQALEDG